jgi:hypothetical protein
MADAVRAAEAELSRMAETASAQAATAVRAVTAGVEDLGKAVAAGAADDRLEARFEALRRAIEDARAKAKGLTDPAEWSAVNAQIREAESAMGRLARQAGDNRFREFGRMFGSGLASAGRGFLGILGQLTGLGFLGSLPSAVAGAGERFQQSRQEAASTRNVVAANRQGDRRDADEFLRSQRIFAERTGIAMDDIRAVSDKAAGAGMSLKETLDLLEQARAIKASGRAGFAESAEALLQLGDRNAEPIISLFKGTGKFRTGMNADTVRALFAAELPALIEEADRNTVGAYGPGSILPNLSSAFDPLHIGDTSRRRFAGERKERLAAMQAGTGALGDLPGAVRDAKFSDMTSLAREMSLQVLRAGPGALGSEAAAVQAAQARAVAQPEDVQRELAGGVRNLDAAVRDMTEELRRQNTLEAQRQNASR